LKLTKIFGAVSLVVFLIGISILVSKDAALAREPDDSGNVPVAAQAANGDGENESKIVVLNNRHENEGGVRIQIHREKSDDLNRVGEDEDDDSDEREYRGGGTGNVTPPPVVTPPPPSTNETLVSYSGVIQPILNQRCNSCHPRGGVNLSNYAGTKAAVNLLPGMGQGYLSSAELQSLLTWIRQGAQNN